MLNLSCITKYVNLFSCNNPLHVLQFILEQKGYIHMDDREYIKLIYYIRNNERIDLDNPKTYTEKLNWLKLYNRKPEYTMMADKYSVKTYVKSKVGEQFVVPIIGAWDCFDEIDFDVFPEQFVLKATHDCGSTLICTNKSNFDFAHAKSFFDYKLNQNYFYPGREWVYKDISPKIIGEQYIEGLSDNNYKFFCFNGEPKILYVAPYREATVDYFDMNFHHLNITNRLHGCADRPPSKPDTFEEMCELARKLSENIPHVRVDLYEVDGKIYFGELTFYHEAGFAPFIPDKWNYIFGEWIMI